MQEQGRIVNIENNFYTIELEEQPECKKCGACKGLTGDNKKYIKVYDEETEHSMNSLVSLEIKPKDKIKSTILVFVIPAVLLILSIVGVQFGLKDSNRYSQLIAVILSLVVLIIYYVIISRFDIKYKKIVKIIPVKINRKS